MTAHDNLSNMYVFILHAMFPSNIRNAKGTPHLQGHFDTISKQNIILFEKGRY